MKRLERIGERIAVVSVRANRSHHDHHETDASRNPCPGDQETQRSQCFGNHDAVQEPDGIAGLDKELLHIRKVCQLAEAAPFGPSTKFSKTRNAELMPTP